MSTFFQFCTAVAAIIGVLLIIKKRLEETMLPTKVFQVTKKTYDGYIYVGIHVFPRAIPTTIVAVATDDGVLARPVFCKQDSWTGDTTERPDTHSASPVLSMDESLLPFSISAEGRKIYVFCKPSDPDASIFRIILKTSETLASRRHTMQIKYTINNE